MSFWSKISKSANHKAVICLAVIGLAVFGYGANLPASANLVDEAAVQAVEAAPAETAKPEVAPEPVTQPSAGVSSAKTTATPVATRPAPRNSYLNITGKVSAPIVSVGLDSTGAIAVPGAAIGMYRQAADTPIFLDGHSDGVFLNLKYVGVGERITMTLADGVVNNYQVYMVKTYKYNPSVGVVDSSGQPNSNGLFMMESLYYGGPAGLNLMTCSGNYLPAYRTYDHRLVVFATRI
jgi:hypothetical protein